MPYVDEGVGLALHVRHEFWWPASCTILLGEWQGTNMVSAQPPWQDGWFADEDGWVADEITDTSDTLVWQLLLCSQALHRCRASIARRMLAATLHLLCAQLQL